MRCARVLGWSLCWALLGGSARADAPPDRLQGYYQAFAKKKLIAPQAAEVRELRQQLAAAEKLLQDGHAEDAALLLVDLTEHPRFADYSELSEMSAAQLALGRAQHALGAEPSAQRALRRVLDRGPKDRYFEPAYRLYVDVALAGQPLAAALEELAPYGKQLPEDAQNELYYLQARERQAANDLPAARAGFERVGRHSRFYASAQFQLGVLASRERAYREAEAHFCKVSQTADDSRYSFYSDARYFRVKDLAQLGLGRVAHEQRRGREAFDYYFRLPSDSDRLPEALFEAAYARYEAKDPEVAIDLLDQLEARFPRSPYADEAALLRGYVALAHCDHDRAIEHFDHFSAHFTPVREEAERILANPARRQALYAELRGEQRQASPVHRSLLALLRVDPAFNELHARVAQLDREAARASRLPESFELLAARYAGSDRPRPSGESDAASAQELASVQESLNDAQRALEVLSQQLDGMRGLGARPGDLGPLEQTLAELSTRQRALAQRLHALRLGRAPAEAVVQPEAGKDEVEQLLARDAADARSFERRALALRPRLLEAANGRALAALEALHTRISAFLRRARIGRIDALMGSKRKLERQVESLAAGRFPPELRDPLRTQGFLRDDEEYWPYEGEDWPDEYRQDEPDDQEAEP